MRKILLFITVVGLTTSAYSQKAKATASFDMNLSFDQVKKQYKAFFDVTEELKLQDGSIVKIGQEVTLGPSSSKMSNTYENINRNI